MIETATSDRRKAEWDLAAAADNYAALAFGQLAGALLSFWALSIVSRALEAPGYGRVVAILALSQAVAQVALHWSVLSLYRHGCQEFVETGRVASTFWTRAFILAASASAVAVTAPLWFGPLLGWFGMPPEAAWLVPIHAAASAISIHVHYALLAAKRPRFQSFALVLSRAVLVLRADRRLRGFVLANGCDPLRVRAAPGGRRGARSPPSSHLSRDCRQPRPSPHDARILSPIDRAWSPRLPLDELSRRVLHSQAPFPRPPRRVRARLPARRHVHADGDAGRLSPAVLVRHPRPRGKVRAHHALFPRAPARSLSPLVWGLHRSLRRRLGRDPVYSSDRRS